MKHRIIAVALLALTTFLAAPTLAQVAPGGASPPGATPATQQAPVAAQSAERIPPPTPPATEPLGLSVLLYYAVIIVLGGATIAISVMPGKRGHQD